jgi:hypothetical protein
MKLMAVTVFGIGYLLGAKAGRERYDQICRLARSASENFDAVGARRRLEALATQLDGYASGASSRRDSSG